MDHTCLTFTEMLNFGTDKHACLEVLHEYENILQPLLGGFMTMYLILFQIFVTFSVFSIKAATVNNIRILITYTGGSDFSYDQTFNITEYQ